MAHPECEEVEHASPLSQGALEEGEHMEYTSANPSVDLLHHFASNLSGIRLHVDLGVGENEYPDPSFFLAIQQVCGSDVIYARFAAIFLDFRRGVKSSEAALEEALKLIMHHDQGGSYHNLEAIRKLLEPFFARNSRMEPTVSESGAQTSQQPAIAQVDLRCDLDPTNSDSTVTISSHSNSSDFQCGDSTSCFCHGCSRRDSSELAGSNEHTTWISLEQKILGILLERASLRLSKHVFRFFHQANRKLRDRNFYLAFLRILESFHSGLIDDFELRVLAYSCVKAAERQSKDSGSDDAQETRTGSVAEFDVTLPSTPPADCEFRSRVQGTQEPAESTRRISEVFRSKVRVEPLEDVSDEDVAGGHVFQDHGRDSTGPLVKNTGLDSKPSERCDLELERASPDFDCPPTYQCVLCEESARDSLECTSLMNRLDLIYSPHSPNCACGSMEDGEMGRRTYCNDRPSKIYPDNLGVSAKPKGKSRLKVENDNQRKEEQRPMRNRKPTAKFLESLQTLR